MQPVKRENCAECGAPCRVKFCSSRCSTIYGNLRRSRYGQTMVGSRGSRAMREQAAPGLTAQQRTRLLQRWKRQGLTCAYCDRLADSIDHVIPLLRGGTNREGNLAPCCRPCNSSKAYLLLVEWRTGKRLATTVVLLPPRVKVEAQRPVIVKQILALSACAACSVLFVPKSIRARYCSIDCSTLKCAHCDTRMARTKTTRPEGEAICHSCRPAFPQRNRPRQKSNQILSA